MARFYLLSLVATMLHSCVLARLDASTGAQVFVPGAFIFEFKDGEDSYEFQKVVEKEGETRAKYDSSLFRGVSIQFSDTKNAEEKARKLSYSSAVKNMWPVEIIEAPMYNVGWTSDITKGARDLFDDTSRAVNDTSSYGPHYMTQIDKLHKNGISGKGIKVAIIDSGVRSSREAKF